VLDKRLKQLFLSQKNMKEQNYANHKRFVPGFHLLASILLIALLTLSIMNFRYQFIMNDWIYRGTIPLLVAAISILSFIYIRQFPVTVQDRAIRAEEGLRHYILTGKAIDPRLSLGQVIALRFAPDEELLALTQRAIADNMKPDDIKKAIKNWKADNHRA